jgi:hypothetical protein
MLRVVESPSAAARKKIAATQKAQWARVKAGTNQFYTPTGFLQADPQTRTIGNKTPFYLPPKKTA